MTIIRLCILLLLSQAAIAVAAGYGGASGNNSLGQVVVIGADADEIIFYASAAKARADHSKSYRFREECKWLNEGERLDCRIGGRSVLNGAVFERRYPNSKKYKNNCGDSAEVLVCRIGCSKRVPRLLWENAWEC